MSDFSTKTFVDLDTELTDLAVKHDITWGHECCPIQGVLVAYQVPILDEERGKTFFGLQVVFDSFLRDDGKECHNREVIERHFTPDVVADPEVEDETVRRAFQRTIWDIENHFREINISEDEMKEDLRKMGMLETP